MLQKLSALSVFCLLCIAGFAQFDYKAQFITKEVKQASTIYILQNTVDPDIAKANTMLEDAVKKYWTATKATFSTINLNNVIEQNPNSVYITIARTINRGLYEDKGPKDQTVFALTFVTCNKEGKLQLNTGHPRVYLLRNFDELDIISAVRLLNSYAEASIKGTYDNNLRVATGLTPTFYRLSELNKGELKNKTLLIDKTALDKKIDEAGIKEIYTGKLKLVTRAEILTAVKAGEKDIAYFISEAFLDDNVPGVMVAPVILDAATGKMLSYSKVTGAAFTTNFNPAAAVVTKGNLKEIVKNAE